MLVGRDRALELIDKDDEEIYRSMLEDVYRKPPPGSNIPKVGEWEFAKVDRWRNAVCMGQPQMFKKMIKVRQQLSREYPNFWLAGDYLKVPCVNGAVASGIETANEVVDALMKKRRIKKADSNAPSPVLRAKDDATCENSPHYSATLKTSLEGQRAMPCPARGAPTEVGRPRR